MRSNFFYTSGIMSSFVNYLISILTTFLFTQDISIKKKSVRMQDIRN